jgi:hypothetical protein
MDSYKGEATDPLSLNLYTYVKNNPVMYIDPSGHTPQLLKNFWNELKTGVSRGNKLIFTVLQAPGNVLRTFSMDVGNGNFGDIPSNFIKSLIGKKQKSVMDLMLSKKQQAEFYEFNSFLYQFSDLALGTLDPVELYGLGKAYQLSKNGASLINGMDFPKSGTLSNVDARKWYLSKETQIKELVDTSLPLERQAKQAFNLRNYFRTRTRELMADRAMAKELMSTNPNLTWDEVLTKYKNKGLSGDDLWQGIIDASTRSRSSVNKSLGLE